MNKYLVSMILGLAASSAFAYSTRTMSARLDVNAEGGLVKCTFSPDQSGIVEKYALYVAWGDADMGRSLADWPRRRKIAEVTPSQNQVEAVVPNEALVAPKLRFFLAEPTLAARTDGISFVDYVRSTNDVLIGTGYVPKNTTALDFEFKVPEAMKDNTYYTIFCSRNTSDSANVKTYTLFLHYKDGKHAFRLDYGKKAATADTTTNLGFEINKLVRVTTQPAADGSSLTATVANGSSTATVKTEGDLSSGGSNEMTLFGCSGKTLNDGRGNYARYCSYGFRAAEGAELKLNLLPAKKTETVEGVEKTTYGLYDTVSGNFKASLTVNGLSGDGEASFCEASELITLDSESGAERSMRVVPTHSADGTYVKSVGFVFPVSDSPIPYVLSAITPDGTVTKVADIGNRATSASYTLPPSRGNEGKATVSFRLAPALPVGYELLPYVEKKASSGSSGAYILTDYYANGTTEVGAKVRCLYEDGFSTTAWAIFCSRSGDKLSEEGPGQALFVTAGGNNRPNFWRYDYGTANGASVVTAKEDVIYTVKAGVPGGMLVRSAEGEGVAESKRTAATFTSTGPTTIFASYKQLSNGQPSNIGNNRRTDIYWFTLKDAEGEMFSFVPVKCTAEGENKDKVGFYDFAQQKFVVSSTNTAFEAPTTEEKSPLVVETDAFTAPEKIGLVVMVY